ncbi:hypothetical protein DFH06DRAFT_1322068 [Mycena polygramma]|nr:hypothetical protein DFH06DRAFT_1322068 [Mycena polygramma]
MPSYKSSMAQTFYVLLNAPLVEPKQSLYCDVPMQDMSQVRRSGSTDSGRSPRPRNQESSESSIESTASS